MEYPFKSLMALDEATARTGYYRDWSHIDADNFHQISELVKFIREKGYGSDTREAIAQALERVYHDAAKSGNANMEVSMARKHFKDLASRLNASDDKLTSATEQLVETENRVDGTNMRIDNLVIPISPENANVEVTDSHVSLVKGKTFSTLTSRLEEDERDFKELSTAVGTQVTNEVNGLGNNLDGWQYGAGELNTDGSGFFEINTSNSVTIHYPITFAQGDKIYVSTNYYTDGLKPTSSLSTQLRNVADSASDYISMSGNVTNETPFSGVLEATQSGDRIQLFRVGVGSVYKVRSIMVINLTKAFGKGNEPDKTIMDDFIKRFPLNYYSGVAYFDIKLSLGIIDNKLANKANVSYVNSMSSYVFELDVTSQHASFEHLTKLYDFKMRIDQSIEFDKIVLTKFGLIDRGLEYSYDNIVIAIFSAERNGVLTPIAKGVQVGGTDYDIFYNIVGLDDKVVSGEFKINKPSWNTFALNANYYENTTLASPLTLSKFVYETIYVPKQAVVDEGLTTGITYRVNDKISDMAPNFYNHWKLKDKDLTIVVIGDSISTNNNYTTPRTDAMYRPPIMIEHSYVSYIEELLRWDGQEYKRYDAPNIFTEVATSKASVDYNSSWDWGNLPGIVNRPSATRVLEGVDCSVAYDIPISAGRCDFIYRTDYLNASSAKVSINAGSGFVQVYDVATNTWIEANNYSYSAKEADELLVGEKGNYRESAYQVRLKMRISHQKNDGNIKVTITNNGSGRLTYWGIQHSPHDHFIDFISSARGGHGITALRHFERVDVDIHKPDLILLQHCILNQGVATVQTVGGVEVPANQVGNSPSDLATKFLNYITALEGKSYSPTVVSYTLFHAHITKWLENDSNKARYFYSGSSKYTGFDYPDTIFMTLKTAGKKVVDSFKPLHEESKVKSLKENLPIMESVLLGSGITGGTWTKDGTHHNDVGAKVVFEILKNLFIS